MKKWIQLVFGIWLMGAGFVQAADEPMLRMPDMPLHDPFIVAHEPTKTYYLYTRNVSRLTGVSDLGTMAYTSKDLKNWSQPKVVFTVLEDSFAQEGNWAPEVHEYQGKFYLFVTLHDSDAFLKRPPDAWRDTYVRGTISAVSDSPDGPFEMLNKDGPVVPRELMTLDGTLYIDQENQPWMVYAHEWLQRIDGTIEAVKLSPDLARAVGEPVHIFKASDAPWLNQSIEVSDAGLSYVTDGPQFYRSKTDVLLMLWSSYESGSYVQTIARSESGTLLGPWVQLDPLVKRDSGHGMLFHTFDGDFMMVLHRPFRNARGKLFDMADGGDHLEILRQRTDLDGDPEYDDLQTVLGLSE
ncbi:glycoside hydrolase family 43 protein [Pelagicoccus sp. SDUM812002]|uniref:glycoside hydrolase family 43 protein n=1 Tax=Pelagicoccus sp. SDUM812002 TaxID=3041266 RepID=UPI00280CE1C6|nr:glycoside hydrolase family 43 protein [Pelagicoccus sp. SDUM812002]MDQ8188018.1 glycoside hydrolase family 43 protein [Pelagicoccus sp. SDUM812002]